VNPDINAHTVLEGLARIVTVGRCCSDPVPVLGELWTDEDGRRHCPLDCATCQTRLLRLNWEAPPPVAAQDGSR
jgi:hypothetical protein